MSIKVLLFPHSHYCEKVCRVLDYKGLPFQAVSLLPGFHMITVRRYAKETSVPLLLDGHEAVQGSSKIIDYLDQMYTTPSLTPENADERRLCFEIESDMDEKLGANLRQILYSRLLDYPDFIRHCFTHPMPKWKQSVFSLLYPLLQIKIYKSYVVST